MSVMYSTPQPQLGSGEVKDRYYKEPAPLSWWDNPANVTKVALAVILVLLAIAVTH